MPAQLSVLHAAPLRAALLDCDSPRCASAAAILDDLQLSATTPWLWYHAGPIGRRSTPIILHGQPGETLGTSRIFGGGGAQLCDGEAWGAVTEPTPRAQRTQRGYHLDLLVLTERPTPWLARASRLVTLTDPDLGPGWCVAARAWRDPDGPWAERYAARPGFDWHYPDDDPPRRDDLDVVLRCVDLVYGRPSRGAWTDERQLAVAARLKAYLLAHPSETVQNAASREGISERTAYRYLGLGTSASDPGGHR